jgi:hypoxanthine phosphoribosyltransferase
MMALNKKKSKCIHDVEANVKDKTVFIVDDILDTGKTLNSLVEHFKAKGAKQVETISAIYKENVDFPNHFFIYKQPPNVNPWYIGYGMDGPSGHSRNNNTIYTL